jgi:hypothetical protein
MSFKSRTLQIMGVCALAAPLLAFAPAAQAQDDFSGSWRSNVADHMHMHQDGDRVTGDFSFRDGQITGHVRDGVLEGIWTQSTSDRRCDESRMGTHYWGHFFLNLSDDGEKFQGRWSYCEDDRGTGGEWHGERRHHRED